MKGINVPSSAGGSSVRSFTMRWVFGLLAALMALAAAVQYNDPDGLLWMLYYGVPGLWAGIAAARPGMLARPTSRVLLLVSVAAALVLTVLYWPPVSGWWRQDVWSMGMSDPNAAATAEQAREGMGIMIATAVLLAVLAASSSGWRRRMKEPVPVGRP